METRPERDAFERADIFGTEEIVLPSFFANKNKERYYSNMVKIANNIADMLELQRTLLQPVFDTEIDKILFKNQTALILGYILSKSKVYDLRDIVSILPKLEDESVDTLDVIRYKRFWDRK